MHNFKIILGLATAGAALAALPTQASAAVTVLDFEGIGNLDPVDNFYAPDYVFTNALALVDSDAGGSGNIANEPSGETVMVFLDSNSAILNAVDGFDTGFSFFYSSNSASADVNVWSGLNATGTLLGTISLVQQAGDNCTGDPNGFYCNWTNAGVSFNGIAQSIDFGGTANFIVYDDITFGSDVAGGGAVPEPSTWAMLLIGFAAVGGALRTSRGQQRTRVKFG